ncbi:MAG TPA: hypothetical protein VMU85_21905 [Stellaceae bacterium]|nr:hypothetical protein [Stellaceae bacterium]
MPPPKARGRLLVALVLCPLLFHLALATDRWTGIASALGIAGFVDTALIVAAACFHTFIYSALLIMFGLTLLPGRDPFVTALSRRMYGEDIPADMVRYTRGVTWAWCLFFAGQLATSLMLFLWAPIDAWSFFVNVLNLPSVVLMFAGEQAVRMVLLRNAPWHSWSDMLRMVAHIKSSVSKQPSSS